jgi:hypothetical protein
MESREDGRKRKRKEEGTGTYLTLTAKNRKTGKKTLHMGAVQWLRYAATHPETMELLQKQLGTMSVGEAFDLYHRAVEQDDSETLQEIHMFFRQHWDEARRVFAIKVPADIGPVPLIAFMLANKQYQQLREELMVRRVSEDRWLVHEPRMRNEFPPEEPHDPVVLDQVLHLVAPWLLSECISEPGLRQYVYPALLVSSQFQSIFQTHIERMLYRKMLDRYPAVETVWPDIWKEDETGTGYSLIIADMEIWPGHWRTIGRVLEMKGLCRAKSAVSLVKNDIRVTYGRERPVCGTGGEEVNGVAIERWRHILPVSKALNLFEAYIRLKWDICFECGHKACIPVRFFVQTDVHGGMVYVCCGGCSGSVFQKGPKPSCDSIPYAPSSGKPSQESIPQGFLFPYARMIQMDLFPLYPTPISHNL